MIPKPVITAWRKRAPWPLDEQVEQDLIISRALIELFSHGEIKGKVAFRGGTALNKLVLPKPLRYSEDIDLNRLEQGSSGELIDSVRDALKNCFDKRPTTKRTAKSIKIVYSYDSIAGGKRKLKIEINVREIVPQLPLDNIHYEVDSEFFSGSAKIQTFQREEMIGTKIRALYQRSKGRDLFDLYQADSISIDWDKAVDSFKKLNIGASQKAFRANLDSKIRDKAFLEDIQVLLPANVQYDPKLAYEWFLEWILPKL